MNTAKIAYLNGFAIPIKELTPENMGDVGLLMPDCPLTPDDFGFDVIAYRNGCLNSMVDFCAKQEVSWFGRLWKRLSGNF